MATPSVPWYVADPAAFAAFVAGVWARNSPKGSQIHGGGYAIGDIQLATLIHDMAQSFADKSAAKVVQSAAKSIIATQAGKIANRE